MSSEMRLRQHLVQNSPLTPVSVMAISYSVGHKTTHFRLFYCVLFAMLATFACLIGTLFKEMRINLSTDQPTTHNSALRKTQSINETDSVVSNLTMIESFDLLIGYLNSGLSDQPLTIDGELFSTIALSIHHDLLSYTDEQSLDNDVQMLIRSLRRSFMITYQRLFTSNQRITTIYQSTIKAFQRIEKQLPKVNFRDKPLHLIHLSRSAGTTACQTMEYLGMNTVDGEWQNCNLPQCCGHAFQKGDDPGSNYTCLWKYEMAKGGTNEALEFTAKENALELTDTDGDHLCPQFTNMVIVREPNEHALSWVAFRAWLIFHGALYRRYKRSEIFPKLFQIVSNDATFRDISELNLECRGLVGRPPLMLLWDPKLYIRDDSDERYVWVPCFIMGESCLEGFISALFEFDNGNIDAKTEISFERSGKPISDWDNRYTYVMKPDSKCHRSKFYSRMQWIGSEFSEFGLLLEDSNDPITPQMFRGFMDELLVRTLGYRHINPSVMYDSYYTGHNQLTSEHFQRTLRILLEFDYVLPFKGLLMKQIWAEPTQDGNESELSAYQMWNVLFQRVKSYKTEQILEEMQSLSSDTETDTDTETNSELESIKDLLTWTRGDEQFVGFSTSKLFSQIVSEKEIQYIHDSNQMSSQLFSLSEEVSSADFRYLNFQT